MHCSSSGELTIIISSTLEFAGTKRSSGRYMTSSTTTVFSSFRSLVSALIGSTRISSGTGLHTEFHPLENDVNNWTGVFS